MNTWTMDGPTRRRAWFTGWMKSHKLSLRAKPALEFFGAWGGNMLIGNRNVNFELSGPKGKWSIGTLDGLAFGAANGKWDFPDIQIKAAVVPQAKVK